MELPWRQFGVCGQYHQCGFLIFALDNIQALVIVGLVQKVLMVPSKPGLSMFQVVVLLWLTPALLKPRPVRTPICLTFIVLIMF